MSECCIIYYTTLLLFGLNSSMNKARCGVVGVTSGGGWNRLCHTAHSKKCKKMLCLLWNPIRDVDQITLKL
jgi:hypothetical protein